MDGGALICFTRWDVQEVFRMAIECAGFKVQSQLVWDKRAYGMGDCKAQFAPNHEVIWFATKGAFAFPGPRPASVITEARPHHKHRFHPTEKPVSLLASLIRSTTQERDLVLDPFAGSCSCGVACVRTNRRFVGIELDGRYASRGRQRIAEARGKGTLFENT
jgi:site-specific DNA-methyltransferase (adenine-specific)